MKLLIFIKFLTQYVFFKLFFIMLKVLPKKYSYFLVCNIFIFVGKITKYNKIAKKNCKIVFPKFNQYEINSIINKSWNNLGKNILELDYLKNLINDENAITVKGIEIIKKIKKNNIQVIFFSIHSGNWEICVPLLDKAGFQIGAIYRHINNIFFDNYVSYKRKESLSSTNSFYTPKGKVSAKEILNGVINKKNIFLLIDQKDSAGTFVNFFGKKVKTQIGFLKIARKYNLKIIPMKNIRLPNNKLEITFEEPIEHNNDLVSDEEKMLEINSIVEKWIRENPENWFWQHKRFN